jgi:hypothetical protein
MTMQTGTILSVLDRCCSQFTFPILDNGYVYLAATRLSLHRSIEDWAMVIEVFGFAPRACLPDTHIYTFASRLHNRDTPGSYQDRQQFEHYIANNPNNDSRFISPISEGDWQDSENGEMLAKKAKEFLLRGSLYRIPSREDYSDQTIFLEDPRQVHIFELCRYVAQTNRDAVLATPQERRISLRPEMTQILQLEEWNHPDVVDSDVLPSGSETFQQLAEVLVTGDISCYRPSLPPNTDWRNWPDGGLL